MSENFDSPLEIGFCGAKPEMCKYCGRKDEARKADGCPHCRIEGSRAKAQTYVLKLEVAIMKRRLALDPLLLEAEAMGFEITIKLPKDSLEAKEEFPGGLNG